MPTQTGIRDLSSSQPKKVLDTGLRRHDGGSTEESIIRAPGMNNSELLCRDLSCMYATYRWVASRNGNPYAKERR